MSYLAGTQIYNRGALSPSSVTIALDAMGGDNAPVSVVSGANLVHREDAGVQFTIFGDENKIHAALSRHASLKNVTKVVPAERAIRDDEKPSAALRASKGTSMRAAIESVERGEAQAIVSGGNTGALMALAKTTLRMLPGIHRPAIASLFPALTGNPTVMLDLGANVIVDAETLAQFAVLGAVFAKAHRNNGGTPSVGLLNVGIEETKGPDHVRSAAAILSNVVFPGRYHGFVEGDQLLMGVVDVIVCDGYAGNIALKTAEGAGRFTVSHFKRAIKSDALAVAGGMLAQFALKRFKKEVDPRLYNGGVFLGLNGLCVKSHGGSDAVGFASAIRLAVKLARHGYIAKVAEDINSLMSQDSFLAHST
ncbi:MAG: phosphate acyltransferase PlsX [Alphaproteobacteria bacterium]